LKVKVLFASGSDAIIARTLDRFKDIFPELPLIVVSEFPPSAGEWIPYHVKRHWSENRALILAKLHGRKIRIGAVILEPRTPYWGLRFLGLTLAPFYFMAFNETGEHFMLRPGSAITILRHGFWRLRNFLRWQFNPGGWTYTFCWRFAHPKELRRPIYYRLALLRGTGLQPVKESGTGLQPVKSKPPGISVVIPSRNGRDLLERCLPRITGADEIIIVGCAP
jgi:hypothetical protein